MKTEPKLSTKDITFADIAVVLEAIAGGENRANALHRFGLKYGAQGTERYYEAKQRIRSVMDFQP